MRSLLVCAAVEDELSALLPGLRAEGRAWRGEIDGVAVQAAPIGVGPVEAALGTALLLGERSLLPLGGIRAGGASSSPSGFDRAASTPSDLPEEIDAAILVGTCGAFPGSGLRIGDVALVDSSLLSASDAAAGLSYIPAPSAGVVRADPGLVGALSAATGLRASSCATVVAITKDGSRASALAAETGAAVEHMEAFGFLRAAQLAGVPAACLLGVANDVGPDGHAQWRANAAHAGKAAIDTLRAFLHASAQGR
ncbi:MAG TPA: hypothetical protein VGD74_00330 [Vulgatibacter sp.]